MSDVLVVYGFLAAVILVPCLVNWAIGHITGTEGRRRK